MRIVTDSVRRTEELGARIASVLHGKEMIALFGDLGAGKTAFTRGLCAGLCVIDGVCSPTFAIVNEYRGKFPIYHFDMYRVTDPDDLFATGFYDYIGNGVMIIEWSENIENELESDCIRIHIRKTERENERIFEIEGLEDFADIIC